MKVSEVDCWIMGKHVLFWTVGAFSEQGEIEDDLHEEMNEISRNPN